jgi:hypothetical protein
MNDHPKARLFVEALYEPETRKTFVRNPDNTNNWIESSIFVETVTSTPVPSVSGLEDCEVQSAISRVVDRYEGKSQMAQLWMTQEGRRHFRSTAWTSLNKLYH